MNNSVKLSASGTTLPVQYLSTLNQMPTVAPQLRLKTSVPDMHFLHQLRAPGSADINQARRTNAATTTTESPNAAVGSAGDLLQTLPPTSVPAAIGTPDHSAPSVGMPLTTKPGSFPLEPKAIASDQLKDGPESAEQAMQQFVGETFYGMLLKQMRNTVMASDLFGNSSAKQMFESQLDQTLVQELATHHSEFLSRPIRI
jgi:hypothetical protein